MDLCDTASARTDDFAKHPQLWKGMRLHFDKALTEVYETSFCRTKAMQNTFVKKYGRLIMLFGPEVVVRDCLNAFVNDTEADPDQLQSILFTANIFESLFAGMGQKLSFTTYMHDRKKLLDDLEHNDYNETEVQNFKILMSQRVADLTDEFVQFTAEDSEQLPFMGSVLERPGVSMNESWSRAFHARLKTAGVASGQLPMLPWERNLWQDDKVPNAPTMCSIPELQELMDMKEARKSMIAFLKKDKCTNLEDMLVSAQNHTDDITLIGPYFDTDVDFLQNHAPKLLLTRFRETILKAFPDADSPKDLSETQAELEELRRSVLASTEKDLADELREVTSLLRLLCQGEGRQLIPNSKNELQKLVANRMVYFCTFHGPTAGPGALFSPVTGRKALECHYDLVVQRQKNKEVLLPADLKEVRMFSFLLTEEQKFNISELLQTAYQNHLQGKKYKGNKALTDSAASPTLELEPSLDDVPMEEASMPRVESVPKPLAIKRPRVNKKQPEKGKASKHKQGSKPIPTNGKVDISTFFGGVI